MYTPYSVLRDFIKDQLYALFAEFGHILRCKLVPSGGPDQSGYGLVQFTNRDDAHRAINSFMRSLFHSMYCTQSPCYDVM